MEKNSKPNKRNNSIGNVGPGRLENCRRRELYFKKVKLGTWDGPPSLTKNTGYKKSKPSRVHSPS